MPQRLAVLARRSWLQSSSSHRLRSHAAHTQQMLREGDSGRRAVHECALLSGLERVHDEWSQSALRRSPCHSPSDHCRAAPPPLRHDAESLHGFIAQREELLRSRFELGTGPGLVRAEFALASRGADGRRREPVQGRATTSRRKGNVRNVVAPQSAGLQLLPVGRHRSQRGGSHRAKKEN